MQLNFLFLQLQTWSQMPTCICSHSFPLVWALRLFAARSERWNKGRSNLNISAHHHSYPLSCCVFVCWGHCRRLLSSRGLIQVNTTFLNKCSQRSFRGHDCVCSQSYLSTLSFQMRCHNYKLYISIHIHIYCVNVCVYVYVYNETISSGLYCFRVQCATLIDKKQ